MHYDVFMLYSFMSIKLFLNIVGTFKLIISNLNFKISRHHRTTNIIILYHNKK